VSGTNQIGLVELVNELKRELLSLETDAQENVPLFSVDQVELELQVAVTKEAGGGLLIHVIQLGGRVERQDVQTVKVTLSPLLEKQERLQYLRAQHPEDWQKLQEVQIQATFKGQSQQSLDELYEN
jgi:hypothetical protein